MILRLTWKAGGLATVECYGISQSKRFNITFLLVGYIFHGAFKKKLPLKNPDEQVFTSSELEILF